MYNQKLLLNQSRYLEAGTSNTTIPISLPSDNELIVDDCFTEFVNLYNVYLDEREQCTKIRLTVNVNLLASNIIFNSVTEIVKNEGSSDCVCLNYTGRKVDSTIGKKANEYYWGYPSGITDAIMDTQISWDGKNDKNYTYLPGVDIFNNHILRSKTFYASCNMPNPNTFNEKFNTLGEVVSDIRNTPKSLYGIIFGGDTKYQNRYTNEDSMTFFESLQNNMKDDCGWLGFLNKCQMCREGLGVSRVLNNESPNKFIDLFPGRDRYTLLPHYNKSRDRYEKNWEYCLAYPFSSTTEHTPLINKNIDTLRILFIDENTNNDDGVYRCIIYTVGKHGLNIDDTINLYKSPENESIIGKDELVEGELVVDEIYDDYSFSVYTSDWVCQKWISVYDNAQMYSGSGYTIKHIIGNKYIYSATSKTYTEYSSSDYLNLDYDIYDGSNLTHIGSKNLSFAKVVNGVQCKYYVRLFSRFPNFDFYDKEVTYENIYTHDSSINAIPVNEYAKLEYEKQSTLSKLGFAKNVYGDNMAEIVYNDDIDISVLEDNLGRPLTSLYLMFFKTNYGYKDWYKKVTGSTPNIKSQNVEWSRCFGKLNCGFECSPYMNSVSNARDNIAFYGNIHSMNNVYREGVTGSVEEVNGGLNQVWLGGGLEDYDEILYKQQKIFYGDLCCYSPYECLETRIQDSYHRFNTAQRELGGDIEHYVSNLFEAVKYSEISSSSSYINSYVYDANPTKHPEGSYYKANYEIPIRSFSLTVSEYNPKLIDIINASSGGTNSNIEYTITTSIENYINHDERIAIFDTQTNKSYNCEVINVLDINILKIKIHGYSSSTILTNPSAFKLYKMNPNIPSYAELMPGNDLIYRWRDIVQNGFEESEGIIPEYPFVNGCLYVHREINIFLRRQDPFGEYGLASQTPYYGLPILMGEENPIENGTANNINDAFNEKDIKC